jgi:hypothetical protein
MFFIGLFIGLFAGGTFVYLYYKNISAKYDAAISKVKYYESEVKAQISKVI